jgi:ABC-type glycerol-3-phosphate transport system substrate-binding protein
MMIRTALTVSLTLLLAVGVVFAEPQRDEPEGPVTLVVRGWDFATTKLMDKTVEQFQLTNPNVQFERVNIDFGDHADKLTLEMASGQGAPDIAFSDTFISARYYKLGRAALVPFDEAIPDYKDRYFASLMEMVTYDDQLWCVPNDIGPFSMFYRQDLLDEAGIAFPESWTEFADVGEKATSMDRFWTVFMPENNSQWVALAQSLGGQVTNANGDALFNNPEMIQAAEFIVDATAESKYADAASIWDSAAYPKIKQSRWMTIPAFFWYQNFALKDLGYLEELDGNWRISGMLPWSPGDPATGAMYVAAGCFFVPSQTEHPEIATEFLALHTSADIQVDIMKDRGAFSANRRAVEQMQDYQDPFFGNQKTFSIATATMDHAPTVYIGEYGGALGTSMSKALTRMIKEGAPIQQAVADAIAEFDQTKQQ